MPAFICAACRQPFEAEEGADEKAHEEARKRFGKDGNDPAMVRVCGDCYQQISRVEYSVRMARTARWN